MPPEPGVTVANAERNLSCPSAFRYHDGNSINQSGDLFMAKPSKSATIREILSKDPTTPVKEIAAKAGVSPNLVYLIKSKMGRKARKVKRQKAVAASEAAGLSDPVRLIRSIRELSSQAGGMKKLKELVDLLAE
jgi:hypothetical protein